MNYNLLILKLRIMEVNFNLATPEQLLNPNVKLWDWKYCISCDAEMPHEIKNGDAICECGDTKFYK